MTQEERNRLVEENQGFVVSMAKRFVGRGLELADLVSEGNLALFEAAGKFDASRGVRLASYAAPIVRRAMEKAVSAQAGLYRVPRNAEGRRVREASLTRSIDAPLSAGNNHSLLDVLPDKNSPDPAEEEGMDNMKRELAHSLSVLDDRERQVVAALYGLGTDHKSLADIAADMGIKRERARQIRDKALRKIARSTDNKYIRAYIRN